MSGLGRHRIVSGLAIGLIFVLVLAAILIVRTLSFSSVLTAVSVVPQQHILSEIRVSCKDLSRLHGTNERIAIADYENAIRTYFQLITNTVVNPISSSDG